MAKKTAKKLDGVSKPAAAGLPAALAVPGNAPVAAAPSPEKSAPSPEVGQGETARGWAGRLRLFSGSSMFARLYVLLALVVLAATTLLWSLLGARVQSGNADQLVNSYLLEHASTFKDALLPGQHTFLFKWPLFLVIKLAGFSAGSFVVATVAVVLATVGLLAFVLYRIERRPLVFGTICLALASALLLVPAQPYAGALLPVNMAMLATRNLEYVLYIAGLVLFLRAKSIKTGTFWVAVAAMSVLIASDKLFLTIGLGAACLALFSYALARRWDLAGFSVNWLFGELAAGVGSLFILWLVQAGHVTHIAGSSSAGPYGFVHSPQGMLIGAAYAFLGFLTNLGANPAFDVNTLKGIPHQALMHLESFGLLPFAVNLLVVAAGVYAAIVLVRRSFSRAAGDGAAVDAPSRLSIMMVGTTLVACAVFIASNHYYAVDARYLAVGLFAIFICLATVARGYEWPSKRLLSAGAAVTVALALGCVVALRTYVDERNALSTVNSRDALIASLMSQRRVKLLVGDYWRVVPSRLASGNALHVMPLSNCTEARQILSSKAWQPELRTNGFAYLLSLDQKLTDYPSCSLKQVIAAYGKPNASSLVAGTLGKPKELLLLYDHGTAASAPKVNVGQAAGPATVLPIPLDQLPNTSCMVLSSMNIVAHEDDDLLFMNPDIDHELKAGHCVRTVFLTAGDAGSGSFYWLGRQQGAEAAYASMLGTADIWVQRIVQLPGGQFVTVANPRGNSKVSLIFMNLPDGNLHGEGFGSSGHEGLARLEAAQIKGMETVDGQSHYDAAQLTDGLVAFMHTYQPAEIRTQASITGGPYPDHSDHLAAGRFAQKAYAEYEQQQFDGKVSIPLKYYIGYPIHGMPADVGGTDLASKTAAFGAYSQFDNAVCASLHPCKFADVFQAYLGREYQDGR
ncbi:MAG TPA: PIG-L family deacetylase [Candidatus Saccharimonadales bacterium]|nr:PIG-L family deacetylase [Candidatus Saccharimonadales bacterium]